MPPDLVFVTPADAVVFTSTDWLVVGLLLIVFFRCSGYALARVLIPRPATSSRRRAASR